MKSFKQFITENNTNFSIGDTVTLIRLSTKGDETSVGNYKIINIKRNIITIDKIDVVTDNNLEFNSNGYNISKGKSKIKGMSRSFGYKIEKINNINESENNTTLGIMAGRFQGVNIGHQNALNNLRKEYPDTIALIVESNSSKDKKTNDNIFPGKLRQEMIKEACPKIKSFIIPNGFLPGALKYLNEHEGILEGKTKIVIAAGADRMTSYKLLFKDNILKLNDTIYEVEYFLTPRITIESKNKNINGKSSSGTLFRQTLKDDDFDSYKDVAANGINTKEWFEKLIKLK